MDRTTTRNPNTTNRAYTERKLAEIKVIIVATSIVTAVFAGIGIMAKVEAIAFAIFAFAITAWAYYWLLAVREGREEAFMTATTRNVVRTIRFAIRMMGGAIVLSIIAIGLSMLVKSSDAFAAYPAINEAAGYVLAELEEFLGSRMH